jgi:preprotein translocase subunit SecG
LTTLFLIVCIFLILLVLIQKGRGGGLSGAFGGAGGNTAFGSKTGDVLTWVTSGTFVFFIILAVILNLVANQIGTPVRAATPVVQPSPINVPAPTTPTTPAAPITH